MNLTAVYMKVPEVYVAFVEDLAGANTQAPTLEEARRNLREAFELVMEANREMAHSSFAGAEVIRGPFDLPGACNADPSVHYHQVHLVFQNALEVNHIRWRYKV